VKNTSVICTLTVSLLLLLLAGCAGSKKAAAPAPPTDQLTIIVLPVETMVSSDDQTNLDRAQQLARGAETMNRLLAEYFADMEAVKVISPEQHETLNENYKKSRAEQAREIGQRLGCDAVLLTTVNRFVERLGSDYSADQPASVAFDFRLMAVKSGRTICSGFFDESQKSLFENLLSFSGAAKRKFKWITAADLVSEGIRQRFESCPQLHHP